VRALTDFGKDHFNTKARLAILARAKCQARIMNIGNSAANGQTQTQATGPAVHAARAGIQRFNLVRRQ